MLARIATAAEIVLAEPGAWLVSAAGFLARGGVLLFLAALLELPSPITLTLIFGVDSLTPTGEPTARLITTIAILLGAGGVAVVAMLLAAAWADVVSVGRVLADERDGVPMPGAGHRRTWRSSVVDVLGVSWLQALGLLPGVLALAVVAPMLRDVAVGEVLLPTSFSAPFLLRVFAGVAAPLARALVVLAVGELLVTVATRRFLAAWGDRTTLGAFGDAFREVIRHPGRVFIAWALGGAVLLASGVVALWAVLLAWDEVRTVFLDVSFAVPTPAPGGELVPDVVAGLPVDAIVKAAGAGALFAIVWVAAVGLVGLGSAFRSTLWTLTVGSPTRTTPDVGWRADAHA